ncbi:MAG: DNA primase large subunit PriL [Candidatus Bathyarchaeia archaeon]
MNSKLQFLGETGILLSSDLAKYPFLPESAEEIKRLDFKIEDVLEPNYASILDRAEKRIVEALTSNPPEVSYDPSADVNVEILSFPMAIVLASATASDYIKRRYALAEARRAYNLLKIESEEKVIEVAKRFGWRIRLASIEVGLEKFDFALHFIDYLKSATTLFHEKGWKLVNRLVVRGEVYLSKQDVARLLQEEIRRHIELKIDPKMRSLIPEGIIKRADSLKMMYAEKIKEEPLTIEGLASPDIEVNLFPPCVRGLYEAALSGRHIPHIGRFTLTSFLLNIGIDPNFIVDLFRKSADFNERMTRYQIEHIAGQRGSRTKYIPPKCDTLQTHGLCPGMDELCRRIKHPLTYYLRRKRRRVSGA